MNKKTLAGNIFMNEALNEAYEGIQAGHGGPFGSVVVKDNKIIGRGHNRVLINNDPTCHGEIDAIRDACRNIGKYDLSGCELYTTGEPCPMCLYACLWARIDKVYYGCSIEDNSKIGFMDEELDSLGSARKELKDYLNCIDREACLKLFDEYNEMEHTLY